MMPYNVDDMLEITKSKTGNSKSPNMTKKNKPLNNNKSPSLRGKRKSSLSSESEESPTKMSSSPTMKKRKKNLYKTT